MLQDIARRARANPFWTMAALLLVPIAFGAYAGFRVLTEGLVVTNLRDLAPWGQWIVADLTFSGLAAGAFAFSALAYLLRRDRFRPMAQMAVFIALLGDGGAMLALLMDIGQPIRFWHPWVYWQRGSMLWLVTISISIYFGIVLLEVFPTVAGLPLIGRVLGRRVHGALQGLGHWLHRLAPVFALVGMVFYMTHQSSLGATYGVVAGRAAPFHTTMPIFFIVSSTAAGIAFTVMMTLLVQWLGRRVLVPREVLFEAGQMAGAILLVYLYMRFWDASVSAYGYTPGLSEAQITLTTSDKFAIPFWVWEMGLGGLGAAIFLLWARMRRSISMLAVGAGLAIAGLVANRWNTTMLAFTEPLTDNPPVTDPLVVNYVPNAMEWGVTLGVLAALSLVFALGMRYLPAFKGKAPRAAEE